jgi:hypothetical protein
MNSISKLIIVATATVFMQSCNMAKHYAHMRINHDNEIAPLQKQVAQPKSTAGYSDEVGITQKITSNCDSVSVEIINQTEVTHNPHPKQEYKLAKNHAKHSPLIKTSTCSRTVINKQKSKKSTFPKLKKIRVSNAKYIDIDEEKTKILLCLVGAGILALLVGLGIFGPVGSVILFILAGIGVLLAVALAFGLLIMGFLAMLGMNFFN